MKRFKLNLGIIALLAFIVFGCEKNNSLTEPNELSLSGKESFSKADIEIPHGAVYTMTNDANDNEVVFFVRSADGFLSLAGRFTTKGKGSGGEIDPLGSQGSLVLTADYRHLFAVNAGSNEISSFAVSPGGLLDLVDKVPSNGSFPVSLTVHGDLLYVVNATNSKRVEYRAAKTDAANIAGFRIVEYGRLIPIPGSVRSLSNRGESSQPAQIQFSPDGKMLVVTEKGANVISTYVVDEDGRTEGPIVHSSAGETPFGFAFGSFGHLIVSEAFGGESNRSAVSSYDFSNSGELRPITTSIQTNQTAGCWVVATKKTGFAYVTNTGSDNISALRINRDGSLDHLNDNGIGAELPANSFPIDAAFSVGDHYLYVLNPGPGSISGFEVMEDGNLKALNGPAEVPGGLPASAGVQGLAAF